MKGSHSLPRHGKRVFLRRLSSEDLDSFQSYRQDEEVGRYQGWEPWSNAKALTFLETMSEVALLKPDTWCQIGIADQGSGALIGDIGICLRPQENEVEMGFSLGAPWQGRGLGSEAVRLGCDFVFEHTVVGQVKCIIDARNLASNRLLRRLGMDHVRTEDAIFRGEPCQEYVFLLSQMAHSSYHKDNYSK